MKNNRREKFLVVDVETTGGLKQKLAYDIGFAVADRFGNIYEKHSFLVSEIFNNEHLMSQAFYSEKLPKYKEDLKKGIHKIKPLMYIRAVMNNVVEKWNCNRLCAYNLAFDKSSLSNTLNYIVNKDIEKQTSYPFFKKEMKELCIWSLSCELLFPTQRFKKWAIDTEHVKPTGNYETSAEVAYRYLHNDTDFIEEHTGLSDVLIEIEIMKACLARKKKYESGILPQPFNLVTKALGKWNAPKEVAV